MIDELKKLYRLFNRREKFKSAGLLFLMVLSAIMEMVGIGAIPAFILVVASPDKVLLHPVTGPVAAWFGIETGRELLVFGSLGLIGFFVAKGLLSTLINYIKIRFVQYKFRVLSHRLFTLYMRAPYTFHLGRNSSELLRNVNHETQVIIQNVFLPILGIALSGISMIFIFALLVAVEPVFSLIAVGGLGGISWAFMKLIKKKTKYYGQDEVEQRKVSNKIVLQGLAGLKDVRVLGRERDFLDQYASSLKRKSDAQFFRQIIQQLQRPVFETITVIGVLGLALVLTMREESIESIIAVLALFAAATYRMMPIFRDLMTHVTTLRYSIYSIDPVFEDLELLKEITLERVDNVPALPFEQEIAFKHVTYVYPNSEEQALFDVSLRIPRGKAVALVGESGAGKTTLVDALLGLLEAQKGYITVDGANIYEHTRAWQRNIGYIPQFIYLTDDTLLRNVAFGLRDEDIDHDAYRQAVEAARLSELIERLPEKEQTVLGERGVRLSGGQRQRVGIARALYHNPQLLIMDEGTSALDNITEKYIIESIERLKGDRTVIMIAHRISTVKSCDVIYFMDQGRIIDQGTYSELIANNPKFREMAGEGRNE
jgi:ATP-binding cassette, subfamily B, bacterial PglK